MVLSGWPGTQLLHKTPGNAVGVTVGPCVGVAVGVDVGTHSCTAVCSACAVDSAAARRVTAESRRAKVVVSGVHVTAGGVSAGR